MPELPEVEILVRHLAPVLQGRLIRGVDVRRAKSCRPTSPRLLSRALVGARFLGLRRQGKYLVFTLQAGRREPPLVLVGHLGMTGRMYLQPKRRLLARHAAVVFDLGTHQFVFEDTRYFGRLSLDATPLAALGPEPLEEAFTLDRLARRLGHSTQSIKVRLLDQSVVAGVGNLYASEILFDARLSPRLEARRLTRAQQRRLWTSLRRVLAEAIAWGSTVPLNWAGTGRRDGLFYYGRAADAADYYEERLRAYGREGLPCPRCGTPIRRITQAARSTFYCPRCQHR